MAKIIAQNETSTPATPGTSKSVLYFEANQLKSVGDNGVVTVYESSADIVWGSISGILSHQLDLQSALDSKDAFGAASSSMSTHEATYNHLDIALNTAARHTHTNKALLDTYNQSNSAISTTIAEAHTHLNKTILDATQESFTTSLKSIYDGYTAGKEPANPNIQAHILNMSNPHSTSAAQVGADLAGTAAAAQAYAIQRANHTGTQLAATISDFASAAQLANSTSIASKADKLITISAGTGLSGGGDLSVNRTISMPNVGTAGTYGSVIKVPVITTDAQGRITGVVNTDISGVSSGSISNISTVSGLTVTDALNNLNSTTIQTFKYTVLASSSIPIYVSLKTWMNWSANFIKIYKIESIHPIGHPIRTPIPLSNCTGLNTLDAERIRFADGSSDSDPSYLVNAIQFNIGISVGDNIEIDYTESQNLDYKMSLVPAGWDFDNNQKYEGIAPGDWGNPADGCEVYSLAIPIKYAGGSTTLTQMGNLVNRGNLPYYLPTIYSTISGDKEIRYLIPNVLIDQLAPLDFAYDSKNIRIEMFELPRNQRKEGGVRSMPYGKFNYMAYFTTNLMSVTNSISFGNNRRYATLGFRLRNMLTNQISDWLPIKIIIRRGFRPNSSISIQDKKQSILVKYELL